MSFLITQLVRVELRRVIIFLAWLQPTITFLHLLFIIFYIPSSRASLSPSSLSFIPQYSVPHQSDSSQDFARGFSALTHFISSGDGILAEQIIIRFCLHSATASVIATENFAYTSVSKTIAYLPSL